MSYSKPEIAVLGDANQVILGSKTLPYEDADMTVLIAPSFERED
jgi:hypothetical protein